MTDALFWYGCNMTRHAEIIRLGTQMLAAVASPSTSVAGWKPPRPRPVSTGSCASRISSDTPFMKPASTGCGGQVVT
jgi:hypothetical protein